jgi:hypothetical protein
MTYFCTPRYSVALNAKVGSSSMARAIIRQYYPKQNWLIRTAAFPPGADETKRQWHHWCRSEKTPSKPVILLVRDPVERFISAMQQVGLKKKDVDAAIESLEKDTPVPARKGPPPRRAARMRRRGMKPPRPGRLRDDVHFRPQHECASGPTKCYRFPDHLTQAAAEIGLEARLPRANEAKREKPTLTPEQEARVRAYYAADQSLFASITQAGHVYTPARPVEGE